MPLRVLSNSAAHAALLELHGRLDACHTCPKMIRPVVHGPPVLSSIFAVGQAPGPHEGKFMRPFAWTAGKTMFGWFEKTLGVDEAAFRERVYLAAVARCFPGKDKGGGDRKPDPVEILACREYLEGEVSILRPRLVVPIGMVAIEQVLGRKVKGLTEVIGVPLKTTWLGAAVDVVCLPHPSGASTWHRMEPGVTLLARALRRLGAHPEWKRTFGPRRRRTRG